MYRRVQATLEFKSASARDNAFSDIQSKMDSLGVFYEREHQTFERTDDTPALSTDARPESDADADELYQKMMNVIDTTPAVAGSTSKHDCPDDDPPSKWYDCGDHSSYTEYSA